MSLGSVPAVPLGILGLDSVLSVSAEGRDWECEWVCLRERLRILMSRMTRRRMSRRKMMQPAPMVQARANLESRKLPEGPPDEPWLSVGEDRRTQA